MNGFTGGWRRGATAALAVTLIAAGCGAAPTDTSACPRARDDGRMRILFVGNSLTYWNQLPWVVRALADSAGALPPDVGMVARPDYGLPDHWADGQAARSISGACWDVVVLQQGPSSLPESRAILLDYTQRFAGMIRDGGARPALFSVWPAESRGADFPRAIESYQLAARAVDGQYLPAAAAWVAAWDRDPTLRLYADGLHPSDAGTWLAAMVITAALFSADPAGFPAGVTVRAPDAGAWTLRVGDADAATFRQATRDALAAASAR